MSEGALHPVGRGMYSTSRDEDALAVIAKRYPGGILTGQTALYAHGLVTAPPDRIDLATKRGGIKIRDAAVRQHFIPEEWLDIYRLQDYAEAIPRGEAHLERAIEEVF